MPTDFANLGGFFFTFVLMCAVTQFPTIGLVSKPNSGFNLPANWIVLLFTSRPPGQYSAIGRIVRILGFLKQSAKNRRNENKPNKQKKKEEKRKERNFRIRLLRRKMKVILRSCFFGKITGVVRQLNTEKTDQKSWEKRRQRRIRKVILEGILKPKKKSNLSLHARQSRKEELTFNRKRRRRIYKLILKRNIQIWADFIRGKGFPKRKKKRHSLLQQLFNWDYVIIAANSLLFFLMAYFLIAFIEKLGMAFTAMHFDYQSILYYYKVEFLVDSDDWYADSVKSIFASGPVLGVIVAILALILYSKVYLEDGVMKLLLLWAIFHGLNSILGGGLIGAFTGKEFGNAMIYMYSSDTGMLVIALVVLLLMVTIGSSSVKYWIFTANSYFNFSKPAKRQSFIISQVFIPYLIGNLLIYFINQPKETTFQTLVNLSLILMILPVLVLNRYHQEYFFDEQKKQIKLSVPSLVGVVVLIAIYRIGLEYGLRLG